MARLTKIELECVVAALGSEDAAPVPAGNKRDMAKAERRRAAFESGRSKLRADLAKRSGGDDGGFGEEA